MGCQGSSCNANTGHQSTPDVISLMSLLFAMAMMSKSWLSKAGAARRYKYMLITLFAKRAALPGQGSGVQAAWGRGPQGWSDLERGPYRWGNAERGVLGALTGCSQILGAVVVVGVLL